MQYAIAQVWTNSLNEITRNLANWPVAVEDLIVVVLLLIAARLAIRLANRMVLRFMQSRAVRMDERRRNTMTSLLENLIRYTIYFVFFLTALAQIHVHIEALLAGAGIAGVAIGFGAQSLIKDILTGFFILFEDQYGVGDVVQINNFTGTVVSIGLRLTRIKAWTGEVEIIPNGQITTVTNYSKNNAIAVVDIGVSYKANLDEAMRIIESVMLALKREDENIIGDIKVLGVQSLRESDVLIRATAECAPASSGPVVREAQLRIKQALDAANIDIPFPQRTVWIQQG